MRGLEEARNNVFRGERGSWPTNFGPRLISTDLKRGRGFIFPPNVWSREDLSPIHDICSIVVVFLRHFVAFCSVLWRRFVVNCCELPQTVVNCCVFAANCSNLRRFSANYGVLRCFTANCGELQHFAVFCRILRQIAAFCSFLLRIVAF